MARKQEMKKVRAAPWQPTPYYRVGPLGLGYDNSGHILSSIWGSMERGARLDDGGWGTLPATHVMASESGTRSISSTSYLVSKLLQLVAGSLP